MLQTKSLNSNEQPGLADHSLRKVGGSVAVCLEWVYAYRGGLVTVTLALTITAAAWLLPNIPSVSRPVLWVYGLALVAWATTAINPGFVGLAAVALSLLAGAVPQNQLAQILAADVIWLILGAFLIGEALTRTGLAASLTNALTASARTQRGLVWRLTASLIALAFFVPSTTGRATLVLPLLRSLPTAPNDSLRRCLSLLIPSVVLVSTPISLIGAAAHLVANEMLASTGQPSFSFGHWLLLAGPFGLVASTLTAWLVVKLHLPQQDQPLPTPQIESAPWGRAEWTTLAVLAGVFGLWLTTSLHSLGFAGVMLIGIVALLAPTVGVLNWKEAIKAVPWDVLIFAGTAVFLGKVLVESGTSGWLVGQLVRLTGLSEQRSGAVGLLAISVIAMTAHFYLTSHTARVAALLPPLLGLASELGWNPAAVMFLVVIGIDYCLTFPVSSKAILLYEFDRSQAIDLLRLSLILMPVYLLLMVAFYFAWWLPLGLSL